MVKSMKIVVLGGSGFIGSILSGKLAKLKYDVTIIDKMIHESSRLFFAPKLRNMGCKVESCDINDMEHFISVLPDDSDLIVHLAANSDIKPMSNGSNRDFHDTLGTTLSLAEALKVKKTKSIFFASSSAIFGLQSENISINLHNEKPLFPISNYGTAKLASEYIVETLFHSKKIHNLSICRFPNVVGKNSTHGILFDFFMNFKEKTSSLRVLGNGYQSKPFMHVDILTDVILKDIEKVKNSKSKLKHINLGPKGTISVREIVEIFLNTTKWDVPAIYGDTEEGWPGDVPSYSFDTEHKFMNLPTSRDAIERAIKDLQIDERFF